MRKLRLLTGMAIILLLAGCTPPDRAMKTPPTTDPWVIRTDFSDEKQWAAICESISAPQKDAGTEFLAYVSFVSDHRNRDKVPHEVIVALPDDYPDMFCFTVDSECIEHPEHPVLVVGFYPSDGQSFDRPPSHTPPGDIVTFRALPSQVQSIQNNLSIANMDFEEFAESVDDDGVFRGFAR